MRSSQIKIEILNAVTSATAGGISVHISETAAQIVVFPYGDETLPAAVQTEMKNWDIILQSLYGLGSL